MKKRKFLSLVVSVIMILGVCDINAFAQTDIPQTAEVYFTISNRGVFAQANDGSAMLYKPVTVTDIDENGSINVDEALKAVHKAYGNESGYVSGDNGYGGISVTKLWGVDTYNTLFTVNNVGIYGVDTDTVSDGDFVCASINKDDFYYGDWYTFFDCATKEAMVNEEITLNLKGHLGMAYLPEDLADTPIPNADIAVWENGAIHNLNIKTDENGDAVISFSEPGTYYVTAMGTVADEITVDWATGRQETIDCPIIAPGCIVTVTGSSSGDNYNNALLSGLEINSQSSDKGVVDRFAQMCDGAEKEEQLSPEFNPEINQYNYTVNYYRDIIRITPQANASCSIAINGERAASGEESDEIGLNVGDNEIVISVSNGDDNTEYSINIHRKAELFIKEIAIDGDNKLEFDGKGSNRNGSAVYNNNADMVSLVVTANKDTAVDISAKVGDDVYSGISGEAIEIPINDRDSFTAYVSVYQNINGVKEAQTYSITFSRKAEYAPDSVSAYLPAPGQFVNLGNLWSNPELILADSGAVTLGAFGGNVVYKYDTPIKNDPKNAYGIDFIITGNCFADNDGATSESAAEPGAVMVSQDGINWYELAGSEYYTNKAERDYSVTYTNQDSDFTGATEILWEDCNGDSGVMPIVGTHTQSYFPNPAYYGKYQNGIGKNDTYTAESVTFCGTRIEKGLYPFGYADSHSANTTMGNAAANPYGDNHRMNYNGDGFDISWAVDDNGNPIELDEISYIKIYNPVFECGTSHGEISPEISSVKKVQPKEEAVGVSEGLESIIVNGETILLTDERILNIDGQNAESLKITANAVTPNSNIYISNQRVESGEESLPIPVVNKLRIIVQEGEKEPVIYILNFRNVPTREYSTEVESVSIVPGDVSITPNENGQIEFSVASGVSSIRLSAVFANKNATALLSGENISNSINILNKRQSDAIALKYGRNEFTLAVTSENGEKTKEYTLVINRANIGSASSENSITVKFSLVGVSNGISQRSVVVPKGATVKYLTEMMFNNNGIDYKTNGVYILEINGLAEFDKGPNSGWLYRCNGVIADESYATKTLSSGDVIKWFYTEDYTTENGYEGGWDKVNGSTHTNKNDNTDTVPTEKPSEENPSVSDISYTDVKSDAWYYDAVKYVTDNKLFDGITDDEFAPDMNMTRAMLVTVLYRLENAGVSKANNVFTDVADGKWYSDAVIWASENGIVQGVTDDTFAPNEDVSREQMIVILYRYAKMKGNDVSVTADLSVFSDYENISVWAEDAFKWANGTQLVNGTSDTELSPQGTATRAQVATILMRFCKGK